MALKEIQGWEEDKLKLLMEALKARWVGSLMNFIQVINKLKPYRKVSEMMMNFIMTDYAK